MNIIDNSLYIKNKNKFSEISNIATSFNSIYNKNNIIQDDIFNILENYIRKNDMRLELFRIPIEDKEFCACTFIKNNNIFVVINSSLLLSKQIFATAHELYHIYCFFENEDDSLLKNGSLLKSEVLEDNKEDIEANAFAGCLLIPEDRLREQINVYDLAFKKDMIKSTLKIMDIFAIPYKAAILRLLEEKYLTLKSAEKALSVKEKDLLKEINLTGVSKRWQSPTKKQIEFGNLKELMYYSKDFVSEERIESDQKRIEELIKRFNKDEE